MNTQIQLKVQQVRVWSRYIFPPILNVFEKCGTHTHSHTLRRLHIDFEAPRAVKVCCVEQCFHLMHTSAQDQQKQVRKSFSSLGGETVHHLLWRLKILLHSHCRHLAVSFTANYECSGGISGDLSVTAERSSKAQEKEWEGSELFLFCW